MDRNQPSPPRQLSPQDAGEAARNASLDAVLDSLVGVVTTVATCVDPQDAGTIVGSGFAARFILAAVIRVIALWLGSQGKSRIHRLGEDLLIQWQRNAGKRRRRRRR